VLILLKCYPILGRNHLVPRLENRPLDVLDCVLVCPQAAICYITISAINKKCIAIIPKCTLLEIKIVSWSHEFPVR